MLRLFKRQTPIKEASPKSDEKAIKTRADQVIRENRKQLERANRVLETEIRRIDHYLTGDL
jgi:hypothetical protein